MTCRLCDNPPAFRGYDGDPADPTVREILVCGIHSLDTDEPIN